jgi:hypothetical protein
MSIHCGTSGALANSITCAGTPHPTRVYEAGPFLLLLTSQSLDAVAVGMIVAESFTVQLTWIIPGRALALRLYDVAWYAITPTPTHDAGLVRIVCFADMHIVMATRSQWFCPSPLTVAQQP